MKKNIFNSYVTTLILTLFFCTANSQTKNLAIKNTKSNDLIEIIQFHSEHRCLTCNKIEKLTRQTLKNYPNIPFRLINVDDVKNKTKAEQFEATGTALFIYNPQKNKMKNLTEFAFMNANNEKVFHKKLKDEIQQFLKG